jgi:pyruvate formate lyase activating enzyme
MKQLAAAGVAVSAASLLWDMVSPDEAPASERLKEVEWYRAVEGGKVQCDICPKNCLLESGQTCYCRTRTNINGRLYTSAWNNPCKLEITGIESGPLYHFMAGTEVLAIGAAGCNLRCGYCQNWKISQSRPERTRNYNMKSRSVVRASAGKELNGILFTYTEPVAYLEYLLDIAEKARPEGLVTAMATSGYINTGPLIRTAENIDAFAVTLKGFSEEFYRKVCGASLKPVLASLETIRKRGRWLEITYLIVPAFNDDPDSIRQMALWIKSNLGDDVPLHFARFVPAYRMKHLEETPAGSLEAARDTAMDAGLKYVYITNLPGHPGGDTYCHNCGQAVVRRAGFKVLSTDIRDSRCSFCNEEIPGIWRS